MSWRVVARKEVKDAARSRVLQGLSGAMALIALALMGVYIAAPRLLGAPAGSASFQTFVAVLGPASAFVPIIAAMLGYKSIAGERASGSLALLLSQPHSRDDVVVGKFVGRTVVLAVPVVLAFAAGFGVVVVAFDAYSIVGYLGFLGALLLVGIAYVSVAVAVSAATASPTWAAVGVLAYYLVFKLLWGALVLASNAIANRLTTGEWVLQVGGFPEWVNILFMLSPHNAYQLVLRDLVLTEYPPVWYAEPYMTAWTGAIVLALWTVAPLTIGLWRFDAVDL
ncbi:ABC-2 type transport system permease protein [Natronoarchaeum philippinense]|uniref:ABC-2 type transport system permease protein n=1 Tax=Natronoarchaeum philippinense TaxID=558529 RepID=A0A285NZX3_NATPI|nr:ABC transporter permease subunit [Natronoarchaeum philippinense]SNZ15020.1 ABC-2 type transport system permease protein [Natronoarchaeum philippinense]